MCRRLAAVMRRAVTGEMVPAELAEGGHSPTSSPNSPDMSSSGLTATEKTHLLTFIKPIICLICRDNIIVTIYNLL